MNKYNLIYPIRRGNPSKELIKAMKTSSICANKIQRQFIGIAGKVLLTDITYLFYGNGI